MVYEASDDTVTKIVWKAYRVRWWARKRNHCNYDYGNYDDCDNESENVSLATLPLNLFKHSLFPSLAQ